MPTGTAPDTTTDERTAAERIAALEAETEKINAAGLADPVIGLAADQIAAWERREARRTTRRAEIAREIAELVEYGDLILDAAAFRLVRSFAAAITDHRHAARALQRPTAHRDNQGAEITVVHGLPAAAAGLNQWWPALRKLTRRLDLDAPGARNYIDREFARWFAARDRVVEGQLAQHDHAAPIWPEQDEADVLARVGLAHGLHKITEEN